MEARTLYSADLGLAGSLALGDQAQMSELALGPPKTAAYAQEKGVSEKPAAERESATDVLELISDLQKPNTPPALEVVLIDARVPDIETLRSAFQRQMDAGRNLAVMIIGPETDGLQRTTQMLAFADQEVSALHIISHGQVGEFSLGSASLSIQNVEARSAELASWSQYLSANADVLIYGCNVAAAPEGIQLVSRLAELTGADVAASKDLTGTESLEANWDLEYHSGTIETRNLADTDLLTQWNHTLAQANSGEVTVNQNLDGTQIGGTFGASHKTIAVNDNGDVAVVWQDHEAGKVLVRLFHPDGSARSNEITVFDPVSEGISPSVDVTRAAPVVAVRADGSFVVSWVQRHVATSDKIHAQRYTAEGIALGGRIDVDGSVTNDYLRQPDIAVDDSGGFVIAYQVASGSGIPDNGNYDVKVSGFNADGSSRFTNIQAGTASSNFEGEASVAVIPNGSFIVAWNAYVPLSGGNGIYAQRFDSMGAPIASAFLVNSAIFGNQTQPNASAADDGSFSISYTSQRLNGSFAVVGSDILMKSYRADGSVNGSEITVAGAAEGQWNFSSSLALDPMHASKVIVVWASSDQSDGSLSHIQARDFDGLGGTTGAYDITSAPDVTSTVASVASNGNLVAIGYSSLPSNGMNPSYDVHLVTHIADTAVYEAVAPANLVPGRQTLNEDSTLVFSLSGLGNAIQVGDSDSAGQLLRVNLSIPAGSGTLVINAPTSVSPIGSLTRFSAPISGTTLAFQGTVTELNQALAQLKFIPTANFNGAIALRLMTSELYGVTPQSDTDFIDIDILPWNDPIAVTVGAMPVTVADGTLTLIGTAGLLSISDIDAGTSSVTFSITGVNGFLTVPTTGTLVVNNVDYISGSDRIRGVSLMGSFDDINTALLGLRYQANTGFVGVERLSIFATDNGHTGNGGTTTAIASLDVNVVHINAAPSLVWSTVLNTSVDEDSSNPLSTLFGIPTLSISDSDAGSSKLTLNLAVTHGRLIAATVPAGLVYSGTSIVVAGPFSGTSVEVEGSLSALNDFIGKLYYEPNANYYGVDTLTIKVDDQQGSFDSKVTEIRQITISPVNDQPSVTIGPMTAAPLEDIRTRLGDIFSSISVSDIDAGLAEVTATVQVSSGVLHLDVLGLGLNDALTGLPLTVDPNGSTISFKGTLSAINAALPQIFFKAPSDANGPAYTLTVSLDDLGNTSVSNATRLVSTSVGTFSVQAVNDGPTIFVSSLIGTVIEDTQTRLASLFSGSTGLSINDVDATTGMLKLTISVSSGTLSLDPSGLVFAATVPNASTLTIQANLADLNTALQRIMFQPASNSVANVTVNLHVSDLGNSGQLSAPGVFGEASIPAQTLSISAVNDPATFALGGTVTPINEDTPTPLGNIFSVISVTDVDAASSNLLVTLSATQGTLSLNTSGLGLFDAATGLPLTGMMPASTTMSFLAPLANINAALPTIVFTPDLNRNGSGFSVTLNVSDQGNTGSLSALPVQSAVTRSFSVNAVNDAPINNAPTTSSTLEDTALVFNLSNANLLSVSDPDGNISLEIHLQSDHGLLSLNGLSGLSFSKGDGVADSDLIFSGTVNSINSALNGLKFIPDQNFSGTGSVTMASNDQGNSGTGGPKSSVSNISIDIQAINDLPTVAAAKAIDILAGATQNIDGAALKTVDLESDPKHLIYTLTSPPTKGELLLDGRVLGLGGQFTQEDVNKGSISFKGFVLSNGADQIQLTVRDADSGSAPVVTISVNIKPGAAYSSGTTSTSTGASSTSSSAPAISLVSITGAATKALTDTGLPNSAVLAAAGIAPGGGAPVAAAPITGNKPSGPNAESGAVKTSEKENAFANLSALPGNGNQTRNEITRLPEISLSAMPLINPPPPAAAGGIPMISELPSKVPEADTPAFAAPGIYLPIQSPLMERIAGDNGFQKNIEKVREDVLSVAALDRGVVASTIGVSASFTIGYILWLIRGGVLISSLLASLPAWKMVDPLPILGNLGKGKDDDESLEEMLDGRHQALIEEPDPEISQEELEQKNKYEREAAFA